jgi:hypothetical protein
MFAKQLDRATEVARAAMGALDKTFGSQERPGRKLRKLAFRAWEAHMLVADVWSKASWLSDASRELKAAKKGRRHPDGPGWPYPGDVLGARVTRKAGRA